MFETIHSFHPHAKHPFPCPLTLGSPVRCCGQWVVKRRHADPDSEIGLLLLCRGHEQSFPWIAASFQPDLQSERTDQNPTLAKEPSPTQLELVQSCDPQEPRRLASMRTSVGPGSPEVCSGLLYNVMWQQPNDITSYSAKKWLEELVPSYPSHPKTSNLSENNGCTMQMQH